MLVVTAVIGSTYQLQLIYGLQWQFVHSVYHLAINAEHFTLVLLSRFSAKHETCVVQASQHLVVNISQRPWQQRPHSRKPPRKISYLYLVRDILHFVARQMTSSLTKLYRQQCLCHKTPQWFCASLTVYVWQKTTLNIDTESHIMH